MSPTEYIKLGGSEDPWVCNDCDKFQFSDSFFFSDMDISSDISSCNTSSMDSPFEELRDIRKSHPNKFIIAHLNINSLKSKYIEIHELLKDKMFDQLFIAETKLDSTYSDAIFDVPGFKLERRDRNVNGGGLASFIRSDIPARRRKDFESDVLENITYEVTLKNTKWCILCIYRPPSMSDLDFTSNFSKTLDKCITAYDKYMVIGDLNYSLLCDNKGRTLSDLLEIFDLTNLISKATCFMKNCQPSLLDVILTNANRSCIKVLNFPTGVSDCHNMISTVINNATPKNEKVKFKYRSFKNLDMFR